MIGRLEGILFEKSPTRVLVDVGGVGYEAAISLSTFTRLPDPGKPVALRVHTHLRDTALQLFGFATELEREVFEFLIQVSRVGPKLAQTLLSGLDAAAVLRAIQTEDVATLRSISGVGARTAERIVVELKERARERFGEVAEAAGSEPLAATSDASVQLLSALVNLQVPRGQAEKIVDAVVAELGEDASVDSLVRAALPRLSR
ncbi:MAG: Holliday junction branch migration protein RuvA [Myxococcales bacterium]|nr:Holliday junction branch migration protein RuvA [Myxococcales bacterium]